MKYVAPYILLALIVAIVATESCHHKTQILATPVADTSDYPDSISSIILTNCAISGCHNQASYVNAANFLLTSWSNMFKGSAYGAEVVAYNYVHSPFLYYVNASYDSTIPIANDAGHLTKPITKQQYFTLRNWIAGGAPDKNGNIPFAANPDTRQKIYLTMNSPCNEVAVIDGATKLVMRYIPVGDGNLVSNGHDITMSASGAYAYLSLYDGSSLGSWVQKIDTRLDTVVGTANLATAAVGGNGYWSIVNISPADTAIMVSGWTSPGYVVSINTATMQMNNHMSVDVTGYNDINHYQYPHGLGNNAAWDTFFVCLQYGNVVNKFSFSPTYYLKQIPIKGSEAVVGSTLGVTPDPHQILMSPDYSKYYVSCESTNEVRVIDAHSDVVLDSIAVGTFPQEMAYDTVTGYLYVVCMHDANNPLASEGCSGSVYVINAANDQVVTQMYGYLNQPHDIAIDHQDGYIFVCSTNANGSSHHGSTCGPDGWYTVYNLNTLLPADNVVYEVLSYPYAIANRF